MPGTNEPQPPPDEKASPAQGFSFALWIAQGFGVGRIPVAPGTFGSVVGVAWFLALLAPGSIWVYLAGSVVGIVVSVWLCDVGERILNQKDPGSVVLDEIIAMPICFLAVVGIQFWKTGLLATPGHFLQAWPLTVAIFALFRFFDIAKPWPVHQSQSLPGGWGVTVDDVLAALYVNAVVVAMYLVSHVFGRSS
jgi:phosphatidylglycerophosphatase A